MAKMTARSVERKIKKLTREINEIDKSFYHTQEHDDRHLYAGMLERKRDDIVRMNVLQHHTAFEDLLNSLIIKSVFGIDSDQRRQTMRTVRGKALGEMLYGGRSLGFETKLNLAVLVGAIRRQTRSKLRELNTLRNKCSHNWVLNSLVRRGKLPAQQKTPLLSFRGRDLHRIDVLKEFNAEYGPLYYRMFLEYIK